MTTIQLTRGKVALIDDDDAARVSRFKWYAYPHKRTWYAARAVPLAQGKQTIQHLHQFILPGHALLDHRNCDGLDNQKHNLRPATSAQSGANRRKSLTSKSRFKGVCWHKEKQKWQAAIGFEGRDCFLGRFDSESEAGLAYNRAALALYGDYARINEI